MSLPHSIWNMSVKFSAMNKFKMRSLCCLVIVLAYTAISMSQDPNEGGEPGPASGGRDSYTTVRAPEAIPSLVDNYMDDITMNALRNILPHCVTSEDVQDVGKSGLSCSQILYLLHVQKYRNGFQPREDKKDIVRKAPSILDFTEGDNGGADDADYSSLFENIIAPAKSAFKGKMSVKVESGFTLPPCEGGSENKVTLDTTLRDCSNYDSILDKLIVPRVLANNFLPKLDPTLSRSFTFTTKDIDFATHWPSLVRVMADSASPVFGCPLNAHQVLWNPSALSTAEVRLVHATDGHKFGVDWRDKDNSQLHYPRFLRSAFRGEAGGTSDVQGLPDNVNVASALLKQNEYLFVPNNMLASVSYHPSSLGDRPAPLLKACLVDASNLNAFRIAAAAPAHLYEYEAALSRELDRADFNVTMDAFPKDVSLADAITALSEVRSSPPLGPQGALETGGNDEENTHEEVASGDDEGADVQATNRKRERRGGSSVRRDRRDRKGRGANLREWVDSNRWTSLVQGLSIPPAHTPVARDVGYRRATLEWPASFRPKDGDMTAFQYVLTVCHNVEGRSSAGDGQAEDCVVVEENPHDRRLGSGERKLKTRVEGKVSVEDKGTTFISFAMEALIAETRYRYMLTYSYDGRYAKASPWASFKTVALAAPDPPPRETFKLQTEACTVVRVSVPVMVLGPQGGDGGNAPELGPKVQGYSVYARMAVEDWGLDMLPGEWYLHDKYELHHSPKHPTSHEDVLVTGLLADTLYEFKVIPYNDVGEAHAMSHSSGLIKTTCKDRKTPEALVYANPADRHAAAASNIHLLQLNDSSETISCSDHPQHVLDAWSSHWSPKAFTVIGKAVYANPIWLDNDVKHPEALVDKIVIANRGSVPMALKAMRVQAAGGKGLIVIDDGPCKEFDQVCIAGSDKSRGEPWGRYDMGDYWKNLRIPVVLIRRGDERILGKCVGHPKYLQGGETAHSEL